MKKIILLLCALMSANVFATKVFEFNRPGGLTAPQNAALDALENTINSSLGNADADRYLQGIVDSNVVAQKTHGRDYVTDYTLFMVQAGVGLAADTNETSINKVPSEPEKTNGLSAGAGVTVGFNLNWLPVDKVFGLHVDRMKMLVSFMSFAHGADDFGLDMMSAGFHWQYKLVKRKSLASLVSWGGVEFITGFEFSNIDLSYIYNVNQSSGGITVTGPLNLGADVTTWSIPIELSTSIDLLYFLSLYGGVALDLNGGDIDNKATADSLSISGVAGVTGRFNFQANGDATAHTFRAFLGMQFNAPFASIYINGGKAFNETNMTYIGAGLIAAF